MRDKNYEKGLPILCNIQFFSSVPGQFAVYAMILGYFDQLEIPLKVMLPPWASGSKQKLNGLSNALL